ncbi:MAG: PIN domain-containing protein [archaeon]
MRLVTDANIAFSLLKKGSFTSKLTQKHSLDLYSHKFILEELEEHSEELCKLLNISNDKFERIKEILSKLVNLKVKVSPQQLNWAKSLISDPDDSPYLALALKLNCPIWSEDPHFKEQSVREVFTTKELKGFLELI